VRTACRYIEHINLTVPFRFLNSFHEVSVTEVAIFVRELEEVEATARNPIENGGNMFTMMVGVGRWRVSDSNFSTNRII
jgi:hypothetical protein